MVVLEKGLSYGAPYITKISGCDGNGHTYECPSAGGATLVIKVCFALRALSSPLFQLVSPSPSRLLVLVFSWHRDVQRRV